MNNEPVAWMLNGIIHECDPSDWAKEQYPDQDVIPLYTHPVKEEHFEDEPQAEELHEIMQSNTHPVEEQDESFDRTASHMAGEYVSHPVKELTEKEKWLTEIDVKQQALKKIIDWLILEHDTLACTSYPLKKAQEK